MPTARTDIMTSGAPAADRPTVLDRRGTLGAGFALWAVATAVALVPTACAHQSEAPPSLRAALSEARDDIAECAHRTQRRDPAARGELLVILDLAEDGQLSDMGISGDVKGPVASPRHLPACILARSSRWSFPAPEHAGRFEIPVQIGQTVSQGAIRFPPDFTRSRFDVPDIRR